MNDKAYDEKNSKDYEQNTLALNDALLKIENDKKLKATIAKLSEMTGVHRNTITNRGWPIQKLNKIKDSRKIEEKSRKEKISLNNSNIKESLEKKLNQARCEVVYWFNEYQDRKRFFEHSDKRLQKMRESRDYYKTLYETERNSLLEAKQELIELKERLALELTLMSSNQLKH